MNKKNFKKLLQSVGAHFSSQSRNHWTKYRGKSLHIALHSRLCLS